MRALSYINFDSSYLLEANFILLFPNGQFLICLNLAFVALKYALLLPFTAQIYNFSSHILLGQKNAVFLSSSMAELEYIIFFYLCLYMHISPYFNLFNFSQLTNDGLFPSGTWCKHCPIPWYLSIQ